MKKLVSLTLFIFWTVVVALLASNFIYAHSEVSEKQDGLPGITGRSLVVDNQSGGNPTYTMADINLHNTDSDCWISLTNGVYDITSLVMTHSGGNVFNCGTDNTALFMGRHGSNFGMMDSYYIGELVASGGSGGSNGGQGGGGSGSGNGGQGSNGSGQGGSNASSQDGAGSNGQNDGGNQGSGNPTYTMDDIGLHSVDSDCWISLTNGVYDITSLVMTHSGGNVFDCGTDNTAKYMGFHGSDFSRMDSYYIGELVASGSGGNNGGQDNGNQGDGNGGGSNGDSNGGNEDNNNGGASNQSDGGGQNSSEGNNSGGNGNPTYTLDDIGLHSVDSDCWISLTNGVYDITSLVNSHPGGNIFNCGNDNTASFMSEHGSNFGMMDSYYIGELVASGSNSGGSGGSNGGQGGGSSGGGSSEDNSGGGGSNASGNNNGGYDDDCEEEEDEDDDEHDEDDCEGEDGHEEHYGGHDGGNDEHDSEDDDDEEDEDDDHDEHEDDD